MRTSRPSSRRLAGHPPARGLAVGLLVLIAGLAAPASAARAGSPAFPWHAPGVAGTVPTMGSVPARVLSQPALTPVEPLPPKQAYPYGWFGPKPTYHWKRSFGVSKAYTQWSRY